MVQPVRGDIDGFVYLRTGSVVSEFCPLRVDTGWTISLRPHCIPVRPAHLARCQVICKNHSITVLRCWRTSNLILLGTVVWSSGPEESERFCAPMKGEAPPSPPVLVTSRALVTSRGSYVQVLYICQTELDIN